MRADEGYIIQGLVDRGVPLYIAQGIAANMVVESGLNPGINEIKPTVPGSRGGFGLNQWTGPRRREYEAFAPGNLSDVDAQLDFTMRELRTTERRAWDALMSTDNAEDAARIYSQKFLRPGIPHLERRLQEARRIATGRTGQSPTPSSAPAPRAGNQLAEISQGLTRQDKINVLQRLPSLRPVQIDPLSFMNPQGRVQYGS